MKRAIVALGALAVTSMAVAIALAGGGSSGPGDGPVEGTAGTYGQRIAVGASTAMSQDEDRTRSMQIIVGVRVPEEGAARSNAIEITYRIGDEQYRETFNGMVIICAPVEKYRECPHAHEQGFEDNVLEWTAEEGVVSATAEEGVVSATAEAQG